MRRPVLSSRTRLAIPDAALEICVSFVRPEEAVVETEGRRLLLLESVYVVRGLLTTARAVLSESMLSEEEMESSLSTRWSDLRFRRSCSREDVGRTGAVAYCLLIEGRRCDDDDEDMSLLSLARALRSLSYSASDISELESSESESVSDDSGSGYAPGIVETRADG